MKSTDILYHKTFWSLLVLCIWQTVRKKTGRKLLGRTDHGTNAVQRKKEKCKKEGMDHFVGEAIAIAMAILIGIHSRRRGDR